jgi:uncharacterized protein
MKIHRLLVFVVLLLAVPMLHAASESLKVVLHINDGHKFGHLANSVKNIRKELGDDVVIEVVVSGKAVTRLLKSNKANIEIMQSVLKQNVPVGLCHNAIRNNRVDKSLLIEGLDVLETDGNVAILNYQRQGYIYIKM